MRRGKGQPSGTVYRPMGRDGRHTRVWWLLYKFPGEPRRRESTHTEDEAEARQQLRERQAERGYVRKQRCQVEELLVDDLLDLYVLDCADKGQPIQQGRVEPWRTALGHVKALEVTRVELDELCRRWRRRGPTWSKGKRSRRRRGRVARADSHRVRPLSGASCNRLVAVLRRAYRLGQEQLQLLTPLTFPHFADANAASTSPRTSASRFARTSGPSRGRRLRPRSSASPT